MNELKMQQMQLICALNDFNKDLSNLVDVPLLELVTRIEKLEKQFSEISMVLNIIFSNKD